MKEEKKKEIKQLIKLAKREIKEWQKFLLLLNKKLEI